MIKKLLKCVREYKKPAILAPLCKMGEVLIECIMPLFMATLIDDGIDKGNMNVVLKMGFILLGLAALSMFVGSIGGVYGARASAGLARNLRKDMYYNVQRFSFANIDKFSTSSIIMRLTTDVTNIQTAFMMMIGMASRCPAMLLFSLIMAYSINAKLALVFLAVVPILGIGLYVIVKNAYPVFKRVFKNYDRLNNVVQENLHGIRVVKAFVREKHEEEKFSDVSGRIYKDFTMVQKLTALNTPLMQFAIYGCILLISWFGARMVVNSGLTTGNLMSLLTYAMQVLISLMMLSVVFVMLLVSRESAERIIEVLDEESDLVNGENPVHEVKDGSVRFENASFSYSKGKNKLCLKNINLDIKSGEIVGIIGGTGSSKTSLIQLIPRLYDVVEGSVKVGGIDVRDYDIEALRSQVALVLQKNELFSGTIKENLRWGNENATDEELIWACKCAQADEFIMNFPEGYDTMIEQEGTNVSGGQKQRLCIARALLKRPKILILDDSTSAVDTKTDAMIRKAFREELADTTKLIIAQRIASVEDADKIIIMNNGMIDAIGTHEELLENNHIYREVYTSQMRGGVGSGK